MNRLGRYIARKIDSFWPDFDSKRDEIMQSGHLSGNNGRITEDIIEAFYDPVNDDMTVEEFRDKFCLEDNENGAACKKPKNSEGFNPKPAPDSMAASRLYYDKQNCSMRESNSDNCQCDNNLSYFCL